MRGDVFRIKPHRRQGHEQQGERYAVVVQSDNLPLSTVIVIPTSTSCTPTSFRPTVRICERETYAMVEQLAAVDWGRLGEPVERLTFAEMQDIDQALDLVIGRT